MADEIERVVVYDRSKDLGDKLAAILGAPGNVYYRPKNNITMTYPAIRYTGGKIDTQFANNKPYLSKTEYEIIYISQTIDYAVINKIMSLPFCSHTRRYDANNLHHEVFRIYY